MIEKHGAAPKILMMILLILTASCANKEIPEGTAGEVTAPAANNGLPSKDIPASPLASESPLNPLNIDEFLFLEDVEYIDLRSAAQQAVEGTISGFRNIPFYENIVFWQKKENILFTMKKTESSSDYLGSVGTFHPNYRESEKYLNLLFPKDKAIIFFSSAGVEAAYMINLLIQYGYQPSALYNAGSFSNSVGRNISYRDYSGHRYFVEGTGEEIPVSFQWELTSFDE